ncbi:type I-G CRISPR-associated helicase/endonuclease Cas3g [Actinomyces howellii]|uniref:Uncharacterized protein predicted to be involved in DNA repair (RAMP superfamily) n=1 Tax=Actinomyces howellii TaxID=52771 RepID=A0A3S5EGZ2_9ACTO|nr:type I-U CRISPR-associated helicase/endonuclease Cas3 [Actinomyces howellii]VEG27161.1 Uncharacterized protein predicted to be involved in DNA repair (RAMP superfamily) [Actinomyces howellii]
MIAVEEFADFFEAVHGPGIRPFSWQTALLEALVTEGAWPEQIAAPTGAGKSSVVEIHVFATAMAALGLAPRLPRRLAVVVNRRAITDAHAQRAHDLLSLLEQTPDGETSVVGRVRDALVGLRPPEAQDRRPLVVTTMRGALVSDSQWLNAPEACAILCMTPAMWVSSLLFRSYGASRFARPRLAGLLSTDAVVVLDEAHLNRQVLVTARRVAALAANGAEALGVPGLAVVEMTATPSSRAASTAGVTRASIEDDERLARRMRCRKEITYLPYGEEAWPPGRGRQECAFYDRVVEQVSAEVERVRAQADPAPRTVGCVVNRVSTAVEVAKTLRSQGLRCTVWVGRMRPWDLERLRREVPGLFTTAGAEGVDVLVATQTVEVGVDIDLAGMVTELASGSAIAQRLGRVNRLGLRERSRVVVIGPSEDMKLTKDALPYRATDLDKGRRWVLARQVAGSASPLDIAENPPDPEAPTRVLWQRPEPWDVDLWSKTSMDLVAEPELDLWIRDDLEREVENVGVVVRDLLALVDGSSVLELVKKVPPEDCEAFPIPIGEARSLVKRILDDPDLARTASVLWRGGEPVAQWELAVASHMMAHETSQEAERLLRPGDTLIVDATIPFLTEGVARADGRDCAEPVPASVLAGVVDVVTDPERLGQLAQLSEEEREEHFPDCLWEWATPSDGSDEPQWLVVRRGLVVDDDSDERSTCSPVAGVLLADHNRDVADRAHRLAQLIGTGADVREILKEAGGWHDIGKRDDRFQRLLEADGEARAKSRLRPGRPVRRAWVEAGLPAGWRHEVASAAAYWEATVPGTGVPRDTRDLVARLIGTSHGRGRPLFDHDPTTAGPHHETALGELLGEGEWEALIARTDRVWGHWGCAYMEALLRAVDCSISAEGK